MNNNINPRFKQDYQYFLCNYVLPLLGIDIKANQKTMNESEVYVGDNYPIVSQEGTELCFCVSGWHIFSVSCSRKIPNEDIKVARRILQLFPTISLYKITGSSRYFPKGFQYDAYKDALYKSAVQNGISRWLAGDKRENKISKLFEELETWAVKTYEGKNVTMGFIINPDELSEFGVGELKWLDFMRDDASAILTDCIHSVIELDAQCNFVKYHSLSEGDCIPSCSLSYKTPLRFSQIIQTYVTDKKRGIFLLNNGDIVLARNQEVCFVRRNLRWLNLSYDAFRNALQIFVDENEHTTDEQLEKLLESIYASVLDVSFSHAGGIVAIVGKDWKGSTSTVTKESILAQCDDMLSDAYEMNAHKGDIRALKRALLLRMIDGKKFNELDRKLRSELLGLDGACILNCNGDVQSFGAIIQNDSGSLGGGRGAAARKLSKYGMAVKISTDGYIELYINGELIYSIK